MSEQDAAPVLQSRYENWVHLILNRPATRNALTEEMLVALRDRLEACANDKQVRAVLLSGAGNSFCAGQDLNERDPRKYTWPFDLEEIQKRLYRPIIELIKSMEKPVVAAVSGTAAGAGLGIALSADIVLAGHTALFAHSFAKVGLSVDAGVGWALIKSLGGPWSRGLLLTATALTGQEACSRGLIWKSFADNILQKEAESLTQSLANGPTLALIAIKQSIMAAEASSFEDYSQMEAELQGAVGRSIDYREGVLSFLERRAPKFQGK